MTGSASSTLVSYEGTVNPERILPAVILFRIPVGLRGLFVVARWAAADVHVLTDGQRDGPRCSRRDIYQAFLRKQAKNWEAHRGELRLRTRADGPRVRHGLLHQEHQTTSGAGSSWASARATRCPACCGSTGGRFNPTGVVLSLCIGVPSAMIQRFLCVGPR